MKTSPVKMLKKTQALYRNLAKAKTLEVAVGLPKEEVTGIVYEKTGKTLVEVGSYHEYGIGQPIRSFLRMPLAMKEREIDRQLKAQYKAVIEKGKDPKVALEAVGIEALNAITDAFKTGGFGTWTPLNQKTIDAKGSSAILIDDGILKNAVTWVVRNVT